MNKYAIPTLVNILMATCPSMASADKFCHSKEVAIATCQADSEDKIFSFCANIPGDGVRYRSGTKSEITYERHFSNKDPLSRWTDLATYTVYLGFRDKEFTYVLAVPEERNDAVAILEILKNNETSKRYRCEDNSFGEKMYSSKSIKDVEDEKVRGNRFIFPPEPEQ